jgi:hypothetical protein
MTSTVVQANNLRQNATYLYTFAALNVQDPALHAVAGATHPIRSHSALNAEQQNAGKPNPSLHRLANPYADMQAVY